MQQDLSPLQQHGTVPSLLPQRSLHDHTHGKMLEESRHRQKTHPGQLQLLAHHWPEQRPVQDHVEGALCLAPQQKAQQATACEGADLSTGASVTSAVASVQI